jgi:hypothetical protein
VQEAINNSKELISSKHMHQSSNVFDTYANDPKTLKALEVREDSVVESPANPKLEPPIDPRVKPMMVQARTKADP